jgi:hypothetical protein
MADDVLARAITGIAAPADLMAIPVMGLPGWSANQDALFYANASVYRARTENGLSGAKRSY